MRTACISDDLDDFLCTWWGVGGFRFPGIYLLAFSFPNFLFVVSLLLPFPLGCCLPLVGFRRVGGWGSRGRDETDGLNYFLGICFISYLHFASLHRHGIRQ